MCNDRSGGSGDEGDFDTGEEVDASVRTGARQDRTRILSVRFQGNAGGGPERILEYPPCSQGPRDAVCDSDAARLGKPAPWLRCDARSRFYGVELLHRALLQGR